MQYYMKKHSSPEGGLLIAGCDEDLAGQFFEEGDFILDVKSAFFAEELVDAHTFIMHIQQAVTFNIVGKNIIALAVKNAFVDEQSVKTVAGIPHVQGVNLRV